MTHRWSVICEGVHDMSAAGGQVQIISNSNMTVGDQGISLVLNILYDCMTGKL